jgi:hypothetical protein
VVYLSAPSSSFQQITSTSLFNNPSTTSLLSNSAPNIYSPIIFLPPSPPVMSDQPIPRPGRSTVQQPANVYYFRPYSFYWPGAFIFIGAFGCSGLTGTVDRGSSILLWAVYIVGLLVIMLIDPLCIFEQNRSTKWVSFHRTPPTGRIPLL